LKPCVCAMDWWSAECEETNHGNRHRCAQCEGRNVLPEHTWCAVEGEEPCLGTQTWGAAPQDVIHWTFCYEDAPPAQPPPLPPLPLKPCVCAEEWWSDSFDGLPRHDCDYCGDPHTPATHASEHVGTSTTIRGASWTWNPA
jgi:hypothetical protein